jgi:Tfp pilus assembly pilus retraction ATPase PilT
MTGLLITDVYLPEGEPARALVYPGPRPAADDPRLAALAERLSAAGGAQSTDAFSVQVPTPTGEGDALEAGLFRGQRAHTIGGELLVFRRLARTPPDIQTLLPKTIVEVLLHPNLRSGGLLVVAGGPGQGKTTTLAATVAGRLRAFGGVCVAAEDPPEIPLHGRHGEGQCLQMEVREDAPLEQVIHTSLRMFPVGVPTLILVGEVRSRAAADEALNAALNGTLVCMTLHASSPVEALHRLVGLAGGSDYALSSLAASLRVILHQRLVDKKARIAPLVFAEKGGESLRGNVRTGKFELLSSDLQFQARALEQGRPIPV